MARATDDMGEPMDERADPRPTRAMPRTPPPDRAPAPPRRRRGNSQGAAPARSPEAPKREPQQPTRAPAKKKAPPSPGAKKRPKPAPVPRRERLLRHTVQKIDLWSVLKLSLCFYLCGLAVTIVALVSLWGIADSFGIVENVEEFIGDLLSSEDFKFLSGEMLRGIALVGLVVVMLQVVITVIAAAFYNLFAQLFGGVEITVIEEEPIPRV